MNFLTRCAYEFRFALLVLVLFAAFMLFRWYLLRGIRQYLNAKPGPDTEDII